MKPFILLALGLILIFIEFYIPGAIIGIIGSILVIFSIVLFASQATSIWATLLFFAGAALSVGLLIKYALWKIVHSKPNLSIYSGHDQEGYQASHYDKTVIGKHGIVLADLKPGGYILIEGKQHQALSITGYIPKGAEVVVLSGQEESLIVKQVKKESMS